MFTREKVCEHALAMRMPLQEVALPREFAAFKVKKKRPRGRPVTGTWAGGRNGRGRGSRFSDDSEEADEEPPVGPVA